MEKFQAQFLQGLDVVMKAFYGVVNQVDVPEVNEAGLKTIHWFSPSVPENYPSRAWPMTRLDHAGAVVVAYLVFVVVGTLVMKMLFGPQPAESSKRGLLMKFVTEPLTLVQAVYNPLQVALCYYMISEAVREYQKQDYQLICNPFHPEKSGMARVVWVFYMSKIFDFFDTVFIVLRRKWTQLSFLHVYHHTTIFLFYWLNVNGGYDGDVYYTVVLNSFVHLVMYAYYFCTTMNITLPSFLKPMVTYLQMSQFVTMNAQAIYILAMGCPYPNRITWGYLIYILSLLVLFANFAKKTYGKAAKGEKPKKQ
eukprot:m.322456 g.322456  ORF g.322456 m.322456 type:complete len:308 (-) comp26995_c0_seq1:30-953(-)